MSETSPYDDLIMDHIKNARNYHVPSDTNQVATGTNPLCGDELTVHLTIADDRIRQIGFQCTCCGISMASASIMSELISGKDIASARGLLQPFTAALLDRAAAPPPDATREQRAILDTVHKYPARARCAALAWATLAGALDKRSATVLSP